MISNCRRRRLGPAGILGFRATVTPLSGSVRLSRWSHRFSIAVESMIVERRHLLLSTASCEQRWEHSNDALPPRLCQFFSLRARNDHPFSRPHLLISMGLGKRDERGFMPQSIRKNENPRAHEQSADPSVLKSSPNNVDGFGDGVAGENPRAGCCVYRDERRNKHGELDHHGRPFV